MPWTSTADFLDRVMAGEQLAGADLDDICRSRVREDQLIDFKDGRWLAGTHPAHGIKEYISGFANASGGVLVVGISDRDDRADAVVGCTSPVRGEDLEFWCKDALSSLWHHFSPLPRIVKVPHPNGDVLVVGIYRAPNLIPCCRSQSGGMTYHVRFGDSTMGAPDFLIADLLLGRRQHPELRLSVPELEPTQPEDGLRRLPIKLQVHNDGLSWARRIRIGAIGWNIQDGGSRLNARMLAHIDLIEPNRDRVAPTIRHAHNTPYTTPGEIDLEPFGYREFDLGMFNVPRECRWTGAAYVMAEDSPPIWNQLTYPDDERRVKCVRVVTGVPRVEVVRL